jgi:predicted Zn finger-like uncharacterized protein
MTVHCPHCATDYLLPDPLVGERGARVRCPTCGGSFVVLRENGPGEPHPPAAPMHEIAKPAPAPDLDRIACDVLDALARTLGHALDEARAEGRLLSRHGPALLDAYDEYRRRAGGGARASFLAALRDRWGLELSVAGPETGSTG